MLGTGTPKRDLELMNRAVAHQPTWVWTRLGLAAAFYELGDRPRARAELDEASRHIFPAGLRLNPVQESYEICFTGRAADPGLVDEYRSKWHL